MPNGVIHGITPEIAEQINKIIADLSQSNPKKPEES